LSRANYPLRLPQYIKDVLEKKAKQEATTINDLIINAVKVRYHEDVGWFYSEIREHLKPLVSGKSYDEAYSITEAYVKQYLAKNGIDEHWMPVTDSVHQSLISHRQKAENHGT
jgi:hypothetical protein